MSVSSGHYVCCLRKGILEASCHLYSRKTEKVSLCRSKNCFPQKRSIHWYSETLMYENVMLPLTLVSNKLNVSFFSTLLQWDENCICFQMYIWRNCAQIVSKFGNHNSQDLTRTNITVQSWISVLRNHNTVTNVDQICRWSVISFPLVTHNTHRRYWIYQRDHSIHALVVCLEPVTTCWNDNVIIWRHICTSVWV